MGSHREAIAQFLEARSRATRLVRSRNKRLEPLIAAGLAEAGLQTDWQTHGGYETDAWNAYHFPEASWSVELKLSTDPSKPSIFIYDYRGRTYKDSTTAPLGLEWSASDEEICNAFIEQVMQILREAASGARPRRPEDQASEF